MKKIISLALLILLLLSLALSASAAQGLALVIDQAGLLTPEERSALEEKAAGLQRAYQMDVVILTVDSLDGKRPQSFADDYYDENGYGEDGMLFLLAMEERDWYVSTLGKAVYALTDHGSQEAAGAALPYLSGGDYFEGFSAFLDALPPYFDAYEAGSPMDGYADYSQGGYHGDREQVEHYERKERFSILPSLIFGLVPAAVTVIAMGASMNTKRPRGSAAEYMDSGSFHLEANLDRYLYSSVTKTPIERDNGGSSGGGSSVHTSSSGRSHGGSGGKF